jgi:transposase-like protein
MPKKIDPELKARAVRMVTEHQQEYASLTAASAAVARKLGVGGESVRRWVLQAQVDSGQRQGPTSAELAEIKALKAAVRGRRLSRSVVRCHPAGLALPLVPPRYRSANFNHVFSGGYGAAYYAYLWSEVLDADTVEWFRENGGLTRANGDRFRDAILSRGDSVDVMEAFGRLRGRAPELGPLLARRGLTLSL